MTNMSKLLIGLIMLSAATATSAQIEFRRPSGVKDRIVTQPAKEPYQPPVRYEPSEEQLNNAYAEGIRGVKIDIGETSASLLFQAPAGSAPVVEIGSEPPRRGAGGLLEFSNRLAKVDAAIVPDKKSLAQINFKAEFSGLERETRYYYIITTPGSDRNASLQTQDRFATVKTIANVTVEFTEITVIRGEGDLFDLWAANRHLGWIGSTDDMLDWNKDGGGHGINKVIEIQDAPDSIEVLVNGCKDTSLFFENNGCAGVHAVPTRRAYKNSSSETNAALKVFNLNEMPGPNVRKEFEIESIQSGEVELAFRVRGVIVVTRG